MKRTSRRRKTRAGQYPLATFASYGPDNGLATKLVISVVAGPDEDPIATRTWTTVAVDVRTDATIAADVADFLGEHGVAGTIVADRIMGCPHQEGIDYPMGRNCPRCPFWVGVDRFTHEPLRAPVPTMSAKQVLEALLADDDRRAEALTSADGDRETLTGPLLGALERGVTDPEGISDAESSLWSYALYLLAKWREPKAYPLVVRWLSLPGEMPFDIGGDIVTQDGARMLAAVCDGDVTPIKQLTLNRAANEYGRGAGVGALALLAAWAELPREPIVKHFLWLAREGLERQPGMVWDGLALACIEIEALEVFPELRRAYEKGLIDPQFVGPEELDEVEAAPRGQQLEETRERTRPIDDVADATNWWDRSDIPHGDGEEAEDHFDVTEPFVAPPKIGRNEPCPCGSGKKFKRCCGR